MIELHYAGVIANWDGKQVPAERSIRPLAKPTDGKWTERLMKTEPETAIKPLQMPPEALCRTRTDDPFMEGSGFYERSRTLSDGHESPANRGNQVSVQSPGPQVSAGNGSPRLCARSSSLR
jgi:hypothetical protein